jgi:biofilm PGA synthesis N-glycosyltransferase PgaC
MDKYLEILGDFFDTFIFYYAMSLCFSYFALAIISAIEMRHYLKKNSFIDYRTILSSHLQPSISLIAPAYNEGANIVENIRSLMSIHYGNYEVLIINDGSKDDSMEKMIESYELELVDFAVNPQLKTKPVRGIYKSRNSAFNKLIVVDKENGGKADALNVGLNISNSDLVACVDVDCVIEQDALVKMVKPFIEEDTRVIATGGVVRIANSCEIENGKLMKVNLPDELLPRIQVVEYIRAFLMGRMAWSRLNGLLLISGAFGLFDREIAVKAGGYNHKTVG